MAYILRQVSRRFDAFRGGKLWPSAKREISRDFRVRIDDDDEGKWVVVSRIKSSANLLRRLQPTVAVSPCRRLPVPLSLATLSLLSPSIASSVCFLHTPKLGEARDREAAEFVAKRNFNHIPRG